MKYFVLLAVLGSVCFGCKGEEKAPPAPEVNEATKSGEATADPSKGPPPPGGWDAKK
jgi:hypothetical protein